MSLLTTRAEKLALLAKVVEGRLTSKDVSDLRQSQEPICITMDLGNGEEVLAEQDPTYHIEIWDDWKQKRCYWKYKDGRIEEVTA